MNNVNILVGSAPMGKAKTWAYPDGNPSDVYRIPTYKVTVSSGSGTGSKTRDFEAIRFGIQKKGAAKARVVGLADSQTHTIKLWLPDYTVHSAPSNEDGAWQVYDNFLVHDGPDKPFSQIYASIGCVEICNGPEGFVEFNDYIISLAEPSARTRDLQLLEIGNSGQLSITYERATRPPLVRW